MVLSPFGDLSHTSILYYCIKRKYFLRYNDFQKRFLTLITTNLLSAISGSDVGQKTKSSLVHH
jgi:hypothetical protein